MNYLGILICGNLHTCCCGFLLEKRCNCLAKHNQISNVIWQQHKERSLQIIGNQTEGLPKGNLSRESSHIRKNEVKSVLFTLHSHKHELSFVFLILTILKTLRWNLKVALIFIFPMAENSKHFFKDYSTIYVSSFQNSLFISLPHFKNWFVFWISSFF